MAVAAGRVSPDPQPAVEPAALADTPGTAGSLVLRRMDRRGHQEGPCAGQEARHQERQRRPGGALFAENCPRVYVQAEKMCTCVTTVTV